MPNYNPHESEKDVLSYWKTNKIYEKAKKKNFGKKSFYFLDGPPYTSGKIHLGTAWNKSLKDCALRYLRMKGLDVYDRAGYDMHGMPVEKRVEEKLKLKSKDEIHKYGMSKFILECEKFAVENLKSMNEGFAKLGVWMDFENAYMPISKEYIEGVWWLVKQAEKNNRLYQGEKTMTWCKSCATALAKHELEYQTVRENSIFIKFQVAGKKNEFFIIWTTTPWTIPFNCGIMVHPELEYAKLKVGNEFWYTAKGLANAFMNSVVQKPFEIVETVLGEKLAGMKYNHPMKEEIEYFRNNSNPKMHSVVLSSDYVDLSAGTGLVHMAPGCGPEDYEVGLKNGILPFNNLNEEGVFPKSMGKFAGFTAKDDDKKFILDLADRNALIAEVPVEHEYAHCWRCKKAVIFKTTTQWFFKVEDLVDEMREMNKKVAWVPDWAGNNWFDSWLLNLRDNSITRQRFWGTPLPIWTCNKCKKNEVFGSLKDLEKKAGKLPENIHKPWIDEVKWKCPCGGTFIRNPDILDVWIDAGSSAWNALDYPARKDLFEKLYPADFILEGKDQIRGWFNLLLITSMVAMKKPSYKAVYMHGFVNDAYGRKMSKSLGNVITPEEVLDKYGADSFRYYAIGSANPGLDMNYNFDDIKVKFRNLTILWNIHNYLIEYAKGCSLKLPKKPDMEEKYILSKMNSTIKGVTEMFENYNLDKVPSRIEELFLELSRTYVQLTRDKIIEKKEVVAATIFEVMINVLKMFAPIAPFISESIYLDLKKELNLKEESVHLFEWPKADLKMIDEKLEAEMNIALELVAGLSNAREKTGYGNRWPLSEAVIVLGDAKNKTAVSDMKDLIMSEVNVKKVTLKDKFDVSYEFKPNFVNIGKKYKDVMEEALAAVKKIDVKNLLEKGEEKIGKFTFEKDDVVVTEIPPEGWCAGESKFGKVYIAKALNDKLLAEGFSRELMRRIQNLRKQAGLKKEDRITLNITTAIDLKKFSRQISEKCGADKIEFNSTGKHKFSEKHKILDKEFEIGFNDTLREPLEF